MSHDTGATAPEVVRAWLIVSRLCGLRELRATLDRVEDAVPADVHHEWLRGIARVLERSAHWVLANVPAQAPTPAVIAEYMEGIEQLRARLHEIAAGEERDDFEVRVREVQQIADVDALAERLITLRYLDQLLDILRLAREAGIEPVRAARAHFMISDLFGIPWLRKALTHAVKSRWDQRLAQDLLTDLAVSHRALTAAAVRESAATEPVDELVAAMHRRLASALTDYRALLDEIRDDNGEPVLAALAVAVSRLRTLSPEA